MRATNVILGLDDQLVVSGYVGNNSPSVLQRDFYLARLTNAKRACLFDFGAHKRRRQSGDFRCLGGGGRDDRWHFERTSEQLSCAMFLRHAFQFFRVINLPKSLVMAFREISIPLSRIQATGQAASD